MVETWKENESAGFGNCYIKGTVILKELLY